MTDKKYKDSAKIVHNFDRNVQSKTDLATSLNNLPEQLKRPKAFTFWRYDSDQKKPPVNAKGLKHNVHKTNNLISFRQAISQYNPKIHQGIGFGLKDSGFVGVDLDDCLRIKNDINSLKDWAKPIVNRIRGNYGEISPSGYGLKFWIEGQKPNWLKANRIQVEPGEVEFYDRQYFTLTGNQIEQLDPRQNQAQQIKDLCQYLRAYVKPTDSEKIPPPVPVKTKINIKQRLDRARRSQNGSQFIRLYDQGDLSDYDNDHSRADYALISGFLAYWLGNDEALIDQAFRDSALMRDKWDTQRGNSTYGQLTIRRAINKTSKVYNPNYKKKAPPARPDQPSTNSKDLEKKFREPLRDLKNGEIMLQKWTPGTGKSYQAQKYAIEEAKKGRTSVFGMQSNQRAEQEAESMIKNFGYHPLVVRGRNQDNCGKHEQAEALGESEHSVVNNLCRKCDQRAECEEKGYLSQIKQIKNQKVILMPFESVAEFGRDKEESEGTDPRFDYIFWDENPDRIVLKEHHLTSYRLEKIMEISSSNLEVEATLELLNQLIMVAFLKGEALKDWKTQQQAIKSILRQFKKKSGQPVLKTLGLNPEPVLEEAKNNIQEQSRHLVRTYKKHIEQIPPRWLVGVIEEIERIMEAEEPINNRLVITHDKIIFRPRRNFNSNSKMVILDAYGRPELYQQVFGQKVLINQHQVAPNWQVHHIPINTSKTRMKDQRIWGDDKWREMIATLSIMVEFERMVVFVDKDKIEKASQAVEDLGLADKISLDYVYKGRGTNQYQDYDAIAIVSQAEPNRCSLVSQARALYGDLEYINDQPEANNKRKFQDKRLQEYKESKQMDETLQTAYRIRPATHSHPLGKKLILCTSSEVEGLTDGDNVIKHPKRLDSIQVQLRRERLRQAIEETSTVGGWFTLAKGLNQQIESGLAESQSGLRVPDFSYINIVTNPLTKSLIREDRKSNDIKGLRKFNKDDLNWLVKNGQIECQKETIKQGDHYTTVLVYGCFDRFKADLEQLGCLPVESALEDLDIEDDGFCALELEADDYNQPLSLSADTKSLLDDHFPHLLDYVEAEGASLGELVEIYQELRQDLNLADSVVAEDDVGDRLMVYRSIIADSLNQFRGGKLIA